MKALVYTAPEELAYRDEPDPVAASGEVLIRVDAVGICGSDMHAWHGHDPRRVPPLILYGVALQRLGRSVSAERQFAAAARAAPADAEAQVAAAVGRFTKANPAAAFSRLGPLSVRFPHAQSVRFHLGELLVWIRQVPQARREFRLAVKLGPSTGLGRTSQTFLTQLSKIGTG